MSAPQTNLETEKRRHRPALVGIVVSLVLAVLALVAVLMWGGLPSTEQAAPDVVDAPAQVQQ